MLQLSKGIQWKHGYVKMNITKASKRCDDTKIDNLVRCKITSTHGSMLDKMKLHYTKSLTIAITRKTLFYVNFFSILFFFCLFNIIEIEIFGLRVFPINKQI